MTKLRRRENQRAAAAVSPLSDRSLTRVSKEDFNKALSSPQTPVELTSIKEELS